MRRKFEQRGILADAGVPVPAYGFTTQRLPVALVLRGVTPQAIEGTVVRWRRSRTH